MFKDSIYGKDGKYIMANELELFFADNVQDEETVDFVVSERFKDKNGKPIPWRLKPVDALTNKNLKKQATIKTKVPGRKGQYQNDFDVAKYQFLLAAAVVEYPRLNDAALMASWSEKAGFDIMTPEDLLGVMLNSGEFENLSLKAQDICGFADINDEVDEAKN